MPAHYVVTESEDGQSQFTLRAADGHVLMTSGWYATGQALEGGMEAVRMNSRIDERFARLTSEDGEPYFILRAANDMEVCRSETYGSTSEMEDDIAYLVANASGASIRSEE